MTLHAVEKPLGLRETARHFEFHPHFDLLDSNGLTGVNEIGIGNVVPRHELIDRGAELNGDLTQVVAGLHRVILRGVGVDRTLDLVIAGAEHGLTSQAVAIHTGIDLIDECVDIGGGDVVDEVLHLIVSGSKILLTIRTIAILAFHRPRRQLKCGAGRTRG